jgi:hypothetical protein
MAESNPTLEGPLESGSFPETLTARVVTPGERPRIHGYDVEGDLARHYGPTDVLLLSLTGELPSPAAAAALRVALTFAAPVSVAHASTHAAVLARLCGSTVSSIIGVTAIALAEQARVVLDEHRALLAWLVAPTSELPLEHRARNAADSESVHRLRDALEHTGLSVPNLALGPARDAAILLVLAACGLRRREQLEGALVTARLPGAFAEAMAERVVDFAHYPINLPRYRYEES